MNTITIKKPLLFLAIAALLTSCQMMGQDMGERDRVYQQQQTTTTVYTKPNTAAAVTTSKSRTVERQMEGSNPASKPVATKTVPLEAPSVNKTSSSY